MPGHVGMEEVTVKYSISGGGVAQGGLYLVELGLWLQPVLVLERCS